MIWLRLLLTGWARDLLEEQLPQILFVLALCLAIAVTTCLWMLSVMVQPAGMWWLAAQAPPELQAQHPIVSAPITAPFEPGVTVAIVTAPLPVVTAPAGRAWLDGPAYNQYSRGSWRTEAMYRAWSPAACSAASLAWLLRAYGRPVQYLDDAVALMNPPFGISTQLGLMDHTGTQVALSLAQQGLSGFKKHFTSTQDLVAGLRDGPLAMDGQRWFGVGHWFVATGSDAGGIAVRESSGYDTRYLTWQQLYGPVGWSGWAVGVLP